MTPLTDEEVAILTAGVVTVTGGLEVLNVDGTPHPLGDISASLDGATVAWDGDRAVHRTCRLRLTQELAFGNVLVLLYMTVTAAGVGSARFDRGVFMLTAHRRVVEGDDTVWDCEGFDVLYLLQRQVAQTYEADAGDSYYTELNDAFAAASLPGRAWVDSAADLLDVPTTKTWTQVPAPSVPDPNQSRDDSPVTWLRVINDLQEGWGGRGCWADDRGRFRCHKYQPPATRAVEFTLTKALIGPRREVDVNQWRQPTEWKFLWKNRSGGMQEVEGDGMYLVETPDEHPMSELNRTLPWPSVVSFDAASQTVLEELGDKRVDDDRRLLTRFAVETTGPLPCGHYDIYRYEDPDVGGVFKVQVAAWSHDLTGGPVSLVLEAVNP